MALVLSHTSSVLLFLLAVGIIYAYFKAMCALAEWLYRRRRAIWGDDCDD